MAKRVRAAKGFAAKYFAKVAELNKLIDQGGGVAKDAAIAKARLSAATPPKPKTKINKKKKRKVPDLLDSRARFPGSFGSGKR
jgi:hypothetical protein